MGNYCIQSNPPPVQQLLFKSQRNKNYSINCPNKQFIVEPYSYNISQNLDTFEEDFYQLEYKIESPRINIIQSNSKHIYQHQQLIEQIRTSPLQCPSLTHIQDVFEQLDEKVMKETSHDTPAFYNSKKQNKRKSSSVDKKMKIKHNFHENLSTPIKGILKPQSIRSTNSLTSFKTTKSRSLVRFSLTSNTERNSSKLKPKYKTKKILNDSCENQSIQLTLFY